MEDNPRESSNLKAHISICEFRYQELERRTHKIEEKVDEVHKDIVEGTQSTNKVVIGAAATTIAGLLSTVVVLLIAYL